MTKWTALIAHLKQKNYEDALKELAVIQNYDDLQDALQVVPFKSLNQDLPDSLKLLENLYAKFMQLANDKEEGRLIIRHVFKANLLLQNYIRFEVETTLGEGLERDLGCKDLIGHITQVTWAMDRKLVDDLADHSTTLKTSLTHYQKSKTLMTIYGLETTDIKSNLQSCLSKYHSFIRHLDSLTKAGARKYSEGKEYTVIYNGGYGNPINSTTRRHPGRRNLSRSRSLAEDVNLHKSSIEQVRKRLVFNQVVMDAIEPCKEDIEKGPNLLRKLRELIENDNKFLEAMAELSSQITRPFFTHFKLEKIIAHFVSSYDGVLSAVADENILHSNELEVVEKKSEISVEKDVEIAEQKVEELSTGLVNHGLKIDVSASSPFRRRTNGRRPLRTHSCREPSLEERKAASATNGNEVRVKESKLEEKLAMKDKQLAETRALVKNLKKREEQLLEKLTAQAKNHLMRSEKFENISDELPRTEQLIKQYDDLYSQIRLDAMDDLDNIESLNCLERSGEIKSHISFAIMTVSFHLAEKELESRRRKIYSLLNVDLEKLENGNYSALNNEVLLQLRRSAAETDLRNLVDEVMEGLCTTMFEFPELRSCEELHHFAETCVRFSWIVLTHVPVLKIGYDDTNFKSSVHSKSHNSDKDYDTIRYYVWPTLLDSQSKAVLFKGVVTT